MMGSKEILGLSTSDATERFHKQLTLIEKQNKTYNAFVTVTDKYANAGYPSLAVKDNILVEGIRCTSSSRVLENYVAPYSADALHNVTTHLRVIGKTVHDPFGAGGSGTTSDFGATKNPFDTTRVPGGSSGGNGVALALEQCDFAIGSDTFGSVRAPAAFCGVVGLRPTYGLVSRHGLMDLAMSLDTIAPMARDVYGVAYLLERMANKRYELDKFSARGLKIVVPTELLDGSAKEVRDAVEKAIATLTDAGAKRVDVRAPNLRYAVPSYYITMFAEFSSAMQRFDGLKYGPRADGETPEEAVSKTRGSYLSEELKRRIFLGTYATRKEHANKWYAAALRGRTLVAKEMQGLLKKGDFIVTPTMPVLPWKIGELTTPLQNYLMDVMTGPPSLAGMPALSVPCGRTVGLQIIGNRFKDAEVLQLGHAYERLRDSK